ncbi:MULTISPECIES: FadR/GntR family transcriptional regulator [Arthrobacter]|uniref:FadR/GntR family transcriptional regulator n=1 Tax=Arthrobacter TaxID=1663 RepID=UPI001D139851|nr:MULTISPECIES: GntR family transcriptional regulator [Arthrobacter]MCC3282844.1 GntR family transcriptional regulator [Arthrobacter caoxuetaonis]MCC9192228.1 GntR family transcriptional regulator [Arthrobacter sp. zg-Y916]
MPHTTHPQKRLLTAVFAPLGDAGKASRVEERIVQGISAGALLDGDRLPSELELAASMGVATVTAREALAGLRSRGLVETRRGREGGTFVTLPSGDRSALVRRRLTSMSRVELRDLAIHYAAIAATAAELAAETAENEDVEALRNVLEAPTSGNRAVGDFFLELAALSQSARLTREYVRLHTDYGSLLGLAHADPSFDSAMVSLCRGICSAVAGADPSAARLLVRQYVQASVAWLIDEHTRLHSAGLTTAEPLPPHPQGGKHEHFPQ